MLSAVTLEEVVCGWDHSSGSSFNWIWSRLVWWTGSWAPASRTAAPIQTLSRSEMMPESLSQGGCCSFSPAPMDTQDTKRMCQAWKSRMHQFVQSPISWRRTCRKESKHGFLGESLDTLLSHKCGLALFRDFLKSEFCEENLDFWLACQEFRSFDSPEELRRRATSIYEEFVRANAKKQVNLDFDTRESISQNLQQPTPSCFAGAQRKIYGLMENSSFPRFVQSEQYKVLVQVEHDCTVNDLEQRRSQRDKRQRGDASSPFKMSPRFMAAEALTDCK